MDEAMALAQRILRHSSTTAAAIITAVTRGINQTISEGLLTESEQFARVARSAYTAEGLAAWMERRTPVYRNFRAEGA